MRSNDSRSLTPHASPGVKAPARRRERIIRLLTYALALTPALTDWLETGRVPATARDYITEIVVGTVIALFVYALFRNTDRLRAIAELDALTGLHNRRKFMEELPRAVETARRLDAHLSLVYIDIDAFKTINDTYGHAMGDAALVAVARLLREAARRRLDACYRIGGDEFALLLLGDGAAGTHEVLEHLYRYRCVVRLHAAQCEVKLSCGSVQLRREESAEDFLRRADANMYRAKHARRRARQRTYASVT